MFANSTLILAIARQCPGFPHRHISLVGYAPCGRNWTAIAGPYWPQFARVWAEAWASLLPLCKDVSACNSTHLAGVHCWNTEMSLAAQLEEQGFSPSGRRSANIIAQRVAAGVQPGRRAMPTLLPEGLGPKVHLELALELVHPFELPVPLPEHCTYAFKMQEKHVNRVNETRLSVLRVTESLAAACEKCPVFAVAKEHYHWLLKPTLKPRNLPFMREVSWITGFSDLVFLPDYVLGMSTLGWGDAAPRFVPRTSEPLYNMSDFWTDVDQHNERIMARKFKW